MKTEHANTLAVFALFAAGGLVAGVIWFCYLRVIMCAVMGV